MISVKEWKHLLNFEMHITLITLCKKIFCHYFEVHVCTYYCFCYGFSDIHDKIELLQGVIEEINWE